MRVLYQYMNLIYGSFSIATFNVGIKYLLLIEMKQEWLLLEIIITQILWNYCYRSTLALICSIFIFPKTVLSFLGCHWLGNSENYLSNGKVWLITWTCPLLSIISCILIEYWSFYVFSCEHADVAILNVLYDSIVYRDGLGDEWIDNI